MCICQKCSAFSGSSYCRGYPPEQSIEGHRNSKVWIVGLNPAAEPPRAFAELENYFDNPNIIHDYFRNFRTVSERLFGLFGKDGGVAHTDLVKCASPSWPPSGVKYAEANEIIANCKNYLISQLRSMRPKLVICNGSWTGSAIKEFLVPPRNEHDCTAYTTRFEGQEIHIVLSGFVGRLDNYAKRRLGREIESFLDLIYENA